MMFAFAFPSRYDSRVTAKSVTGFGDPNSKRRTSATIDGAFLVPVSYIFLAFYRFYLSPGVRTSGTPGQVLKKSKRNL